MSLSLCGKQGPGELGGGQPYGGPGSHRAWGPAHSLLFLQIQGGDPTGTGTGRCWGSPGSLGSSLGIGGPPFLSADQGRLEVAQNGVLCTAADRCLPSHCVSKPPLAWQLLVPRLPLTLYDRNSNHLWPSLYSRSLESGPT